ncbi:MAG: hypothetical protein JWN32_679, partial [Solirubrobacterales bacterium]|nr:hypothetical protein [Solirubrobacterales bacterium]
GASNLAAPTSAQPATARVDPRSPDARDAALAAQTSVQPAAARVDPRSPDARDAARAAAGVSPSASVQPAAAAPAAITVTEHSSQTLAIVFSACALAIALLAVGFVAVSRRPRPRWNAP